MRVPNIKASLTVCGTCGKTKTLGQRHTCRTRLDKPERRGKTRFKPKFSYSLGPCDKCHKQITSLPHTCNVGTDFKKRKAEQEKRERAEKRKRQQKGRRKDDHPLPEDCEDQSCQRFACVHAKIAFRRGHAAGYASGFVQGKAEGIEQGYKSGYAAGQSDAASTKSG